MIYTDLQFDAQALSEIERHSYVSGDHRTAELAAMAIDGEEQRAEAERLQSIVYGIRERITEANWRTGKKAELRELVEAIVNELAEG